MRDQQLRHLQQQIEHEAAALGQLTQERQQLGGACALTKSMEKSSKRRRARIRQLVETISAWQQRDLPSSPVTEPLPQQWTEQAIKQLFSGQFPWQQMAGGAGQLPSQLVDRFRDACAEVSRRYGMQRCRCDWNRDPSLAGGHCSELVVRRVQMLRVCRRPAPLRSWSTCVSSGSALCSTSST